MSRSCLGGASGRAWVGACVGAAVASPEPPAAGSCRGRRVGRRSLVLPLRGDQAWRPTARHGLAGSGLGHLVQRLSPLGVPAARVSAWVQAPAPIAFQLPAHTLGGRCGVGIPGFGLIQPWLLGASGSEPAAWGSVGMDSPTVARQLAGALHTGSQARSPCSGEVQWGRRLDEQPQTILEMALPTDLGSFLWPQPGEGPTQDHPCALQAEW